MPGLGVAGKREVGTEPRARRAMLICTSSARQCIELGSSGFYGPASPADFVQASSPSFAASRPNGRGLRSSSFAHRLSLGQLLLM